MDRTLPRMVAIDPGSNCGYSWVDIPSPLPPNFTAVRHQSGLWELKKDRFSSQGMRFIHLKKQLFEVEPDFVLYEQVNFAHKSTAAAQMYWGSVTTIQTFCDELGIECVGVETGVVKKRATGKGNAGKPQIIAAANEFFEIDPPLVDKSTSADDNIADAMWILQVGIEMYAPLIRRRATHADT